ncbi:MAG: hypothetical protein Q4B32_11650 [Clostridia bacterium]|nr:hypothetical protein [Clostridia bacterium]
MGRGRGGYTGYEMCYKDSGGHKVTDKGSIFVAERYIDKGYEVVFKQTHEPKKTCDLLIKTSDDSRMVKYIEVKRVTSENSSKLATNIGDAFTHFSAEQNGTAAIYLPNHRNGEGARQFVMKGFLEAKRKGWVNGKVEIWFNDRTKIELN